MSSTIAELGTLKDLEIIWVDRFTQQPKDMNNVTVEVYHYEDAAPPRIVVPIPEPYRITEGVSDTVNIASLNSASGYIGDDHITLDLNVISDNLEGLGCAPNDYVVCGTNNKVSIVNGVKVYSLSACELASLINLDVTEYTASAENGYLVITGLNSGSDWALQVGNGTFNTIVGLVEGDEYYGQDLQLILDLPPTPMNWVSTGRYVYTDLNLSDPPFTLTERYFVLYRGIEPVSLRPEISQEDFTLVNKIKSSSNLTLSFTT